MREGSVWIRIFPVRHPLPITDRNDITTITSVNTWDIPKEGLCPEVSDKRILFKKAIALKEIIRRFTGSDIYHGNLQKQYCETPCGYRKRPLAYACAMNPASGAPACTEGGGGLVLNRCLVL